MRMLELFVSGSGLRITLYRIRNKRLLIVLFSIRDKIFDIAACLIFLHLRSSTTFISSVLPSIYMYVYISVSIGFV